MDETKILIIGSNGQLGTALREHYPNARATDSSQLDITNQGSLNNYDWSNISTIINAGAYTNVDGAETSEGRISAWQVNAVGVANLSRIALERELTILHISTEYVFDGTTKNHTENEVFSPLSVYGQSKAAGDIAVSVVPNHYIVRTSWVIGNGKNFVRTMIELGQKGIEPKVVADQIGRLTFTSVLVRAIDHLLINNAPYGTYNVSNSGDSSSWADITRSIFNIAGYNLNVSDVTTEQYFADKPLSAPRPLESTLDLNKLGSTNFISTDWKTDLNNYVNKELSR